MENASLTVTRKFHEMTEEHQMLGCSSVVLALSGGADSTVLLSLLHTECRIRGISLYAIHIHHGIRGEEADRDATFCRMLCESLSVPLETVKLDIPDLAKREKKGLEECAREHRYQVIEDFRKRQNIDRIATAHNADDNLESLLFHLTRGAATGGAMGIAPVRGRIIRPLLLCTKEEILAYAHEMGLSYVTDSTNADTAYTRNYLRSEILPRLRSINPRVSEAAMRYCRYQRADSEYLDRIAEGWMGINDCRSLSRLAPPILRRVLQRKYADSTGNPSMPASQTDALLKLVANSKEGSSLSLTGGYAVIRQGRLEFCREFPKQEKIEFCYRLHMGENPIPEADALICLYPQIGEVEEKSIKEKQNIYKLFIHRSFAFDKIGADNLLVRNRADGDRIRYGGISRSVKKLFWEKKIPIDRRDKIPIICQKDEILWIPGFPLCDRIRSETASGQLHLCYFSNDGC
ncbi:MAG: tRNA lysidine(34) synthetase TilS [Eubacteriales bacterium]